MKTACVFQQTFLSRDYELHYIKLLGDFTSFIKYSCKI